MVNHARTLLLNISGSQNPGPSFPGEEMVPSAFKPFSPSGPVSRIRNLLFGHAPDRAMLNYRLAQYMAVIHATELEEYVLDLDNRVTYLPLKDHFLGNVFGTTVSQYRGEERSLRIIGGSPDSSSGRLLRDWIVEVASDSVVQVTLSLPFQQSSISYSITNGLSELLPLVGSSMSFYFQSGVDSAWTIRSLVRPSLYLADILSSLESSAREDDLLELFGAAPIEPYKTFRNLWYDREEAGYKLGGLLLALIYRSNEAWGA